MYAPDDGDAAEIIGKNEQIWIYILSRWLGISLVMVGFLAKFSVFKQWLFRGMLKQIQRRWCRNQRAEETNGGAIQINLAYCSAIYHRGLTSTYLGCVEYLQTGMRRSGKWLPCALYRPFHFINQDLFTDAQYFCQRCLKAFWPIDFP